MSDIIDFWKNEWDAVTNTDDLFDSPDPQGSGGGRTNPSRRPKWQDVYDGYPKINTSLGIDDMPTSKVFTSVRGTNYEKDILTNACATRVSLGLLNAGMNVPKDFLITVGVFRGNGFIASAVNLQKWLSKISVWGSADEKITGPTDLSTTSAIINGRNGVYIILGGFGGGISGHATLWVGNTNNVIGGHNYIDYGGTVYFWELK